MVSTNGTIPNIIHTNITTTSFVATSISSAGVYANNITSTNLVSTTGTIPNIIHTNVTSNNLVLTSGSLNATFNSNTIGNIFTTGGNVGVGTNAPSANLTISALNNSAYQPATSTTGSAFLGYISNGAAGASINFDMSTYLPSLSGNTPTTRINLTDLGSANSSFNLLTKPPGGGIAMISRVFVDGSGNVGINTTNPGFTLDVNGAIRTSNTGVCLNYFYGNGQTSEYWKIGSDTNQGGGAAGNFNIYNNNNTGQYMVYGSTSWTANSDMRLKKNIQTISSKESLNDIEKLKPVTYHYTTDSDTYKRRPGLIAQEVQVIFPDIVSKRNDGILGVSYTEFIPYLIGSIKELSKLNKELTERIFKLETNFQQKKTIRS